MPDQPRVLVGMLSSSEPQRDAAIASARRQIGASVDILLIEGLENVSAHRSLYQAFEAHATHYEWLVKLDADMVLTRPTAISDAIALLRGARADYGVFVLDDWLTDTLIYGVNVFRSGLRWHIPEYETLFVDPDPVGDLRKVVVDAAPAPFAQHAPEPSAWQAFHFGYHRASKMLQVERRYVDFSCRKARTQRRILLALHRASIRRGDRRQLLALCGAVLASSSEGQNGYRSQRIREQYEAFDRVSDAELRHQIARTFGAPLWSMWLVVRLSIRCVLSGIMRRPAHWLSAWPAKMRQSVDER